MISFTQPTRGAISQRANRMPIEITQVRRRGTLLRNPPSPVGSRGSSSSAKMGYVVSSSGTRARLSLSLTVMAPPGTRQPDSLMSLHAAVLAQQRPDLVSHMDQGSLPGRELSSGRALVAEIEDRDDVGGGD